MFCVTFVCYFLQAAVMFSGSIATMLVALLRPQQLPHAVHPYIQMCTGQHYCQHLPQAAHQRMFVQLISSVCMLPLQR